MTKKNLIFCGISHLSLNYGATAARFKNDVVFFLKSVRYYKN